MTLPFNVIAIVIFVRYFLSGSFKRWNKSHCEQNCSGLRISEFQNHITKRFGILLRALKFLAERLPNEEKGKQSEKTEDGKAIEQANRYHMFLINLPAPLRTKSEYNASGLMYSVIMYI